MKSYKIIALLFMLLALGLGAVFYMDHTYPSEISGFFKKEYYGQLGPLAICVELFIAGLYLFRKLVKANFALALFGFTVVMDAVFNLFGIFSTQLPLYAMIIFWVCALLSFWLAFTDTFKMGKISWIGAIASFILGNAVELFFNYW